MNQPTTPPAADPLEALAAQAASLEQSQDAAAAPEGEAKLKPKLSNAQAIAGAIGAGREAFCYFTKLSSPRRVLDDDTVAGLGELWSPVLEKYGISLGDYLGDYALEITALMGTVAIAVQLRNALNAEIKAQTVDEEKTAAPEHETQG